MGKIKGKMLVMFLIFAKSIALAQTFGAELTKANNQIWGFVSTALQGGLFILFVFSLWKLIVSRDKQGDWIQLLLYIVGIIAIRYAPALYSLFAGSAWTGAGW